MSSLLSGADRVRIEIEVDGQTRVVEMAAEHGEKIQITLDLNVEVNERPDTVLWREFEPSGRIHVRLDAFGHRADTHDPDKAVTSGS
ncbi:hypothetical protein OHA21_43775 [Actinoplanes sp. NBC_00393]|uniref:hypothetical protein n=1 Tax=Actinoplanes sp. NBC_00393 TaxID=2975953 RepID=UPI002E1E33AE